MLAEIQLKDEERAAVTDGTNAVDDLLKRLADVPTPAGPTPREIDRNNFIPINSLILTCNASIDRPTTEATS